MKHTSLFIISLVLLFTSCKKDEISIDPNNQLIGIWNVSAYDGNATLYVRSPEFIDEYGFQFNSNGTLTERQNSGWCGTPPITYADYSGSWKYINDTLIEVEVGFWGGISTYQLDIELLDSQHLKTIMVLPETGN